MLSVGVYRELFTECDDFFRDLVFLVFIVGRDKIHPFGYLLHLRLFKSSRRDGGRADPDSARDKRTLRIVRDGILIYGNMYRVKAFFHFFSRDIERTQIDKREVVIGAAGYDGKSLVDERVGKGSGVFDYLLLILFKLGL